MKLEGISRDEFKRRLPDLIYDALCRKDERQEKFFTDIMDTARSYELEKEATELSKAICLKEGLPDLWELPKSFEIPVKLVDFPASYLPKVLQEYLSAVSEHVQVCPEMIVLPMLSVLSLCVQGKAVVNYPGNNHTEPLNLYTMTIAAPGERKSSSLKQLVKPVEAFQKRYNSLHAEEIKEYQTEKAFLERQKLSAMNGKNANLDKAKDFTRKLHELELEEKHELKLIVKDTTPEGLAWELYLQNERLAILDDEGSVFDVLSGLYSNGQTNINIFLEAYDGSSYSILRRTKESITLYNPLLTIGLMVQPTHFEEAMNNNQFSGRGFIYRFLFCFPESKAGFQRFISENIDAKVQQNYNDLIERLLSIPYPKNDPPVIYSDQEAAVIFKDYFDHLQLEMRPGGRYENMKEWASKQFAKCLRIAAILHLCDHTTSEPINGDTAFHACGIALWTEEHAVKALAGDMTDTKEIKNAKYILSRLKQQDKDELTFRELKHQCRAIHEDKDFEEPLAILEERNYIKGYIQKTKGRSSERYKLNPLIDKY
ncbi:MAG: YfjI family protein [Oscillospiraceae bacterium]